jgi:hypothetical protein
MRFGHFAKKRAGHASRKMRHQEADVLRGIFTSSFITE